MAFMIKGMKKEDKTSNKRLRLFLLGHLNLMYSSIHEEDHAVVIRQCYWPLLQTAERCRVPVGIELTGYTLERIDELDRSWVDKLKELCSEGLCEVAGAGYSQIIGPLTPQKLNEKNLEIGLSVYEKILGIRPKMAYVNEQAYSSGMADLYIDAGFESLFMEWNNVYSSRSGEWSPEWQYFPQYAVTAKNRKIPVVWNNAVSFQRMQRYVHGDISEDDYIKYLMSNLGDEDRFLCMYGNDVEVFDYRPGRYHTEAQLEDEGEWKRFEHIVLTARDYGNCSFILPSDVLRAESEHTYNELTLSNAASPIPVKKQFKYNITRWALTGRDDVRNNGSCARLLDAIEDLERNSGKSSMELNGYWKELCYLWSSDFRTHITDGKYAEFIKRQGILEYRISRESGNKNREGSQGAMEYSSRFNLSRKGQYTTLDSPEIELVLNSRRGMAINSLVFKKLGGEPLLGTLHQGYFSDITWGVDLYSGHVVVQPYNQPKITDLEKVNILEEVSKEGGGNSVYCSVKTPSGTIHKSIYLFDSGMEIRYIFEWNGLRDASFHSGILTINPDAFDIDTLYYSTHNGGPEERYYLKGQEFSHSQPVMQSMISASHCLGATEGIVRIGDSSKVIAIKTDRYPVLSRPMIEFSKVDEKYLLRLYHSLGEHDETSHWMWKGRTVWKMSIELELES